MKLLVVEDDELLQQGLAWALTGEGYVGEEKGERSRAQRWFTVAVDAPRSSRAHDPPRCPAQSSHVA